MANQNVKEHGGAAWSVALTDEEIKSLAEDISPSLIRPDKLLGYWPLEGESSGHN